MDFLGNRQRFNPAPILSPAAAKVMAQLQVHGNSDIIKILILSETGQRLHHGFALGDMVRGKTFRKGIELHHGYL